MRKQGENNQHLPSHTTGSTVLPEQITVLPGTTAGVSPVTRRLPVVIAAGRGLKDPEGLALLYAFADRLREVIAAAAPVSAPAAATDPAPAVVSDPAAAPVLVPTATAVPVSAPASLSVAAAAPVSVVATRGAVEEGLLPVSEMVGMSGRRVTAGLYIAVGVSGSNFHTAGIRGNPYVVAVNPDPKARIHELADCSIYRDCKEVLREWQQPQHLVSLLP